MTIKEIKKEAFQLTRMNWLNVIVAYLVRMIMFVIVIFISRIYHPLLAFCLYIFTDPPLTVGLRNYYLQLSRREVVYEFQVFNFFPLYIACFKAVWRKRMKLFFKCFCFLVPGVIDFYKYRYSYFAFIDDINKNSRDTLKFSKKITKGNKRDMFLLDFKFAGWWFLAYALGLILLPLVSAYSGIAHAIFYKEVCEGTLGESKNKDKVVKNGIVYKENTNQALNYKAT